MAAITPTSAQPESFLTFVRMKKQEFLEGLLRADFCSKRYFIY